MLNITHCYRPEPVFHCINNDNNNNTDDDAPLCVVYEHEYVNTQYCNYQKQMDFKQVRELVPALRTWELFFKQINVCESTWGRERPFLTSAISHRGNSMTLSAARLNEKNSNSDSISANLSGRAVKRGRRYVCTIYHWCFFKEVDFKKWFISDLDTGLILRSICWP